MHRNKEIVILIVLFVVMAAGTLWYVADRRAKNRALAPKPPAVTSVPLPANEPVALGTKETERKTIDFSSGKPVVKDSPEDKAALDAGLKDIADATKDVTFGPTPPPPPAQPAPAEKKP